MNPYAISGRHLSQAREQTSATASGTWSFVRSIFNAEISSITAIAFVLFAATSVGALTMVAQTELSGGAEGILAGAFNTTVQTPRVLGVATYGYNQPVCGYNTVNCLTYQLIGFSGNGWQVKVDYQLQGGITGAIKVNSWPFMDGITGSGSGYTGNDLLPNQTYTFILYKKIGSRLQQLTSLNITAPAKPSPTCAVPTAVPQNGCYDKYDNNGCQIIVCPTPPPAYGYTTPHYGQGSNSLIEGWLESMSSYSATAPGSVMVSGWAYNNGGNLNINIKLVNSATGVSYPAAVTTPVPSYRQDVANYITQIVGSAPNGLNGMFTATVGNLPSGTYYIVATFGGGYAFNVLGQVPATITVNPVPAAGLLKILSPNGGEKFVTGSNLNIQWTGDDPSYLIHLYLIPCANSSVSSCGNGLYNLGSNEPNNGSFNWTVQGNDAYGHTIPSGYYQAWIQDNHSISDDKSDAPFVITQSISPTQTITIAGPSSTATVGQYYMATLNISPSNAEYTMTSDGNLPPGLSLSQNPIPACLVGAACPAYYHNTYTLSGTPTTAGTYTFQLKAVDTNGNIGTNTFTITVNGSATIGVRTGQLVFKSDKTVYLVGSNVLYPISSVAVFNSWGWTFSQVSAANSVEAALPVSGTWVPSRNPSCSDAISQINGTCSSSQSTVSVTIPAGGEQWAVGSTHIVTWVPNSSASPTVNIELVSSTDCTPAMISACTNYQVIASNVPNNGSYAWTIASPTFGTMGASNYYKVAVSYPVNNCTANNGGTICTYVVGGTSGAFTIVSAASSTSIKIFSPAGGEQWALGSIHMITWDASTTGGYPLSIVLTGASGNYSLTTTAPNTGSYSWTISNNLSVGNYTLTISGPQMCTNSYPAHCYGVPDTSQSFSLVNPTNSVVNINSLNPASGPVGTVVTVSGSGFASTGNNVSMRNYQVASNLTSSDGKTLQFTIPETLAPHCAVGTACPQYIVSVIPGDYSVVVTNANGTSNAQIFSVTLGTSVSARVGQLVYKTDKTVYLVGQSVLYPIPSVAVFNSWGWSFANVLPTNAAESALPVSGTWVPSRNPACSDAISQINGMCGSTKIGTVNFSVSPASKIIAGTTGANLFTFSVGLSGTSLNLGDYSVAISPGDVTGQFSNVGLYDQNGNFVAAVKNVFTGNSNNNTQYDFSFTPQLIKDGQAVYYAVRADISSGAAGNYSASVVGVGDNSATVNFGSSANFSVAAVPISGARIGQLVFTNGGTVYLVGSKGLYGIPDIATFNSWGWSFSQVVAANSAEQALSQIGTVPMKQVGCSDPLSQINNACGSTVSALTPPIITGPTSVMSGVSSFYVMSVANPSTTAGYTISYTVDWGDGSQKQTGNDKPTGLSFTISHTWQSSGIYNIMVYATDSSGRTSSNNSYVKVSDSAVIRPGTIINNNGTVQLVGQNGLYGFPSVAIFNSWGFSFANVVAANSAEQALSQVGVVSMKQQGCNAPLDQIAGTCGSTSNLSLTAATTGSNSLQVSTNNLNQMIAAFTLKNNSNNESALVKQITLQTSNSNVTGNFQNLKLMSGTTQLSSAVPSPSNGNTYTFSLSTNPLVIAPQATIYLNIYVDVTFSPTNITGQYQSFITLSSITAQSSVNNQTYPAIIPLGGQLVTVQGAVSTSLSATLSAMSPVSQFIVGGSMSAPIAVYNLAASSAVTVQQLTFTVSGSGITSVLVSNLTAPVVGGTAVITGLNLPIPAGYAGANIPVSVNYASVGANGIPSGNTSYITLSSIKYSSGGITQTATANVNSNTMKVVGSYPTLSLVASNSSLTTGSVKVASVVVNANASGNIVLTALPISVTVSGATISTTNAVTAVDSATGQVVSNSSVFGNSSGGTLNLTFNGGNTIAAGASKTYDIYIPVTAITANSASLSLSPGSAGVLTFNDVNGAGSGLSGSLIVNYPTNTVSIHN